MTELLYHTDSYLKEFDASLIGVVEQEMLLDRTAFFPGGGGQPRDDGILASGQTTWKLVGLRKQGDEIWHRVDGLPPAAGDKVHGVLDWQRRYQLMRTHTAMHILCGVIWRDHKASVTGGNMEPLRGRMDFEFENMGKELVEEIESKINIEVGCARPVRIAILPREQAFQIPDLIRTKVNLLPEGIQEVRVVEVEGLDIQADGGTHVSNNSDVGPLKIVEYLSKGAINKRLVLALEG